MNPHDTEEQQASEDHNLTAPHEPGRQHVNLVDAPVHDELVLPPRHTTIDRTEYEQEDDVKELVIPHVHVVEKFEEVEVPIHKKRFVKDPQVDVLYRKIKIPKPVKTEKTIEVPQLHVVDRITEKFVDIPKTRVVQKPKYIIQERIIPIHDRKIEEIDVKIPKAEFEKLVNERMEGELKASGPAEESIDVPWEMESEDRPDYVDDFVNRDEDTQGVRFRHVPKPVEIPIVHYKAQPVERLVDRFVPVPVELDLTQEFHVPTLVPVWNEVPVPVHVSRRIEKPVPAECFMNKDMLSAYLSATREIDIAAAARANRRGHQQILPPGTTDAELEDILNGQGATCCTALSGFDHPVRVKMSASERAAAGLRDEDIEHMKSQDSHTYNWDRGLNRSVSRGFLAGKFSMREQTARPDAAA